jgi:hypothetical protein
MAWCKVSSLTAATARTLQGEAFPLTRSRILVLTSGRVVEGWDVGYFLGKALKRRSYADLRGIMKDLEAWLEAQGQM